VTLRATRVEEQDGLRGIQDVARLLGVTPRTLRFYENQGLLAPSRIGPIRVYRPSEIARMRLILRAKLLGFSLQGIRRFLELYDTDPKAAGQARVLAERCRAQILRFEEQRIALDRTIVELVDIANAAEGSRSARPSVVSHARR